MKYLKVFAAILICASLAAASRFSPDAKEYVNRIEKKIILMDGQQLASLSIEFRVGVADVISYSVRKLDLDSFEEE